jgi:hypothetical protein
MDSFFASSLPRRRTRGRPLGYRTHRHRLISSSVPTRTSSRGSSRGAASSRGCRLLIGRIGLARWGIWRRPQTNRGLVSLAPFAGAFFVTLIWGYYTNVRNCFRWADRGEALWLLAGCQAAGLEQGQGWGNRTFERDFNKTLHCIDYWTCSMLGVRSK